MKRRRFLLSGAVSGLAPLSGCAFDQEAAPSSRSPTRTTSRRTPEATRQSPTDPDSGRRYYVSPTGDDSGPGTSEQPLGRVQEGIIRAEAGDTVSLLPGEYQEAVFTVRGGKPGQPITIRGPSEAVLRHPEDAFYTVTIKHSHVHLRGLTIDGLRNPDAPDEVESYAPGPLITCRPLEQQTTYLRDVKLIPSAIGNGQSALIRLIRCSHVEIGEFELAGIAGANLTVGDEVDHVAEVIYVGTGFNQIDEPWYPWDTWDRTHHVHIHHIDNSEGHVHGDFVAFEPGTYACLAEYCTDRNAGYSTDGSHGPSFVHGGRQNTVRYCDIAESPSGIAFDGNEAYASSGNNAYHNVIRDTSNLAIAFVQEAPPSQQGAICGNEIDGEVGYYDRPDESPDVDVGSACPVEIPPPDGVGHTGGDSPWT